MRNRPQSDSSEQSRIAGQRDLIAAKCPEDAVCIAETSFVSQTIAVKGTPLISDTTNESGR